MAYVREQRGLHGWNPNTRHVMYGLDADLIFLALATHEPHFYILRELVFTAPPKEGKQREEEIRERLQQAYEQQAQKDKARAEGEAPKAQVARKPYQFLSVSTLRDYLALELHPGDPSFRTVS